MESVLSFFSLQGQVKTLRIQFIPTGVLWINADLSVEGLTRREIPRGDNNTHKTQFSKALDNSPAPSLLLVRQWETIARLTPRVPYVPIRYGFFMIYLSCPHVMVI